MKKIGMLILAVVLLLLLVTALLFFIFENGKPKIASPSDYARIDSLRFCGSVPTQSEKIQKIRICGTLILSKSPAPIRIYIYKMPDKSLVAQNDVNDELLPGEFNREFSLSAEDAIGKYKAVAYFYKQVVGEAEFEIPGQ